MLSKNKIKFIRSLSRKKFREQEHLFLVEGNKMVQEALQSGFRIEMLLATDGFLKSNPVSGNPAREMIEVTGEELRTISLLQSPQQALAIVKIPERTFSLPSVSAKFSLALDCIQDPGNLGTIIRVADWFGIQHLLCSENTVDCYNPKVIQSSMGSILRVQVHYLDLKGMLEEASALGLPLFGTFLEGENIYRHPLGNCGILVMGNEGNGISAEIGQLIHEKIHIPAFPENNQSTESLNVATATAICCAEFRRRLIN